jgi:D-methionine transport system substrate-binding protein
MFMEAKVMKKRILLGILALGVAAAGFCGGKKEGTVGAASDDKIIKFASCNLKAYEDSTKVLAAEVAKLGYKLEYVFLADNTQLNEAVERGEYFANYHQHTPYMNEFNREHKAHLAAAFTVFNDLAGLYTAKKYQTLNDLPSGATIVIPADAGNNFRAFTILIEAGLLRLKDGVTEESASQSDIVYNPKNFKFIEVDYTMLSRTLEDADAGFLYATVAFDSGIDPSKILAPEPARFQAADIIAVRAENLNSEKAQILKKAFYTDAVKQSLRDSFGGKEVLKPEW